MNDMNFTFSDTIAGYVTEYNRGRAFLRNVDL